MGIVELKPDYPEQLARAIQNANNAYLAQRLPVGTILMWPGTTAPAGTLILQGQLVNRADYPDLWQFAQNSGNIVNDAQWSNRKGSFSTGNGSTTFRLPDLRGRVPVGYDSTQAVFNVLGQIGGEKAVTLQESQVPSKTWRLNASSGSPPSAVFRTHNNQNINVVETADYSYATGGTLSGLAAVVSWSYGGGQAHNNLQPYATVNFIIIAKADTTASSIESALAELISQTQAARDSANQAAQAVQQALDDIENMVGKKTPEGGEIFNSYTGSAANRATAPYSHAEGGWTSASGDYSHAEGSGTTASGYASHAEGGWNTASGDYSHAEGRETIASGYASHAEGSYTTASGDNSHAEGSGTTASGYHSHAEGLNTTAAGVGSHTEGYLTATTSAAAFSHAGGYGTIASAEAQTAIGKYNAEDTNALFIVGNGTSSSRSNAFTVKLDGSATVQTQGTSNNSVIIKSTLDTALAETKSYTDTVAAGKADKSNTYTKTEVDAALSGKVDKVAGKDLSTNDYTNSDKAKVANLPENTNAELALKANAADIEVAI